MGGARSKCESPTCVAGTSRMLTSRYFMRADRHPIASSNASSAVCVVVCVCVCVCVRVRLLNEAALPVKSTCILLQIKLKAYQTSLTTTTICNEREP